ncbi:spermidine/putrescine ABC transporter substrate-binding protein, partial [Streptomyces sp. NEAU-H3]|nr:spermidine/putrescine ABC transporter substrate-binding protein [Streptomyces sp. NEAU-H3]
MEQFDSDRPPPATARALSRAVRGGWTGGRGAAPWVPGRRAVLRAV